MDKEQAAIVARIKKDLDIALKMLRDPKFDVAYKLATAERVTLALIHLNDL